MRRGPASDARNAIAAIEAGIAFMLAAAGSGKLRKGSLSFLYVQPFALRQCTWQRFG